MIIYLSGAISGVPNYKEVFRNARERLEKDGLEVISPAEIDAVLNKNAGYDDYMKVDMMLLSMADGIVLLPGWENSKGCRQEYGYALGKEMLIIHYDEIKEL